MKRYIWTVLLLLGVASAAAQTDTIRYVKVTGQYTNNGRSWANAKNDVQDAINDLNSVLARDPDNFVALWQITVCKALMAEYEKHTTSHDAELRHRDIVENFRRLMQMSPNNPIILYCYGTYDARNEHYDEAIKLFSKAIELSPQMPYAYYNRGLAYMKAGKPVEARKDFSKSGELGLFGAYNLLKK